jgi:predicted DNA-binding transcriptional regulator AlpA
MTTLRKEQVKVIFGDPGDTRGWVACANFIAQQIAEGKYPQGDWLPPARIIAMDAGVPGNYPAAQNALKKMALEGLVSLAEGTGYYAGACEPPRSRPGHPLSHIISQRAGSRIADLPLARDFLNDGSVYVSPVEIAAFFRCSKMTIYREIKGGNFAGAVRFGRTVRVPVSSVRTYIDDNPADISQLEFEDMEDE